MMEIFPARPDFDFIGKRFACFTASGVLAAAALGLLAVRGLNYGIDFTGGTVVQITYEAPQTLAALRSELSAVGFPQAIPQQFTDSDTFSIRLKSEEGESSQTVEDLVSRLQESAAAKKFVVDQKEYVGPTVGRHLYKQAMFAVLFSLLGIVGYVAFRFSNPLWGVAGVIALAHDVVIMLGIFSLLRTEIDLVMVAAVLTLAGYSINDTIVIFDRMRENMRILRRESLDRVINLSVNETLSRTLITSVTTFVVVLTLFLLGGAVIHDFAMTLSVGILIGTYSSIGVAAPLVYQWELWQRGGTPAPAAAGGQAAGGQKGKGRRNG